MLVRILLSYVFVFNTAVWCKLRVREGRSVSVSRESRPVFLHDQTNAETDSERNARRCASRFDSCADGPLTTCNSFLLDRGTGSTPAISFLLVTGSKYVSTAGGRPWAQLDTWLSKAQPGSWAYVSDAADDRLPAYEVAGTSGGWKASQGKWLGMLERLASGQAPFDDQRFFPGGASWLFVGDDDTFVWRDTLQDRLSALSSDPDKEALYLGLPDARIARMLGLDLGSVDSYCLGGAGFLLSKGLAKVLEGQDIQGSCGQFFEGGQHSDIAVARCLERTAGIRRCTRLSGLNQKPFTFNTSDAEADDSPGDYPACAPISFHWMQPEGMRRLWHIK